jgi:hypothetical protein
MQMSTSLLSNAGAYGCRAAGQHSLVRVWLGRQGAGAQCQCPAVESQGSCSRWAYLSCGMHSSLYVVAMYCHCDLCIHKAHHMLQMRTYSQDTTAFAALCCVPQMRPCQEPMWRSHGQLLTPLS